MGEKEDNIFYRVDVSESNSLCLSVRLSKDHAGLFLGADEKGSFDCFIKHGLEILLSSGGALDIFEGLDFFSEFLALGSCYGLLSARLQLFDDGIVLPQIYFGPH